MNTLLRDVRYALRVLLKRPGFTAVAVITLALGIGANTAIFSLVSAVLVRPLKYRDAERLVMVWETTPVAGLARDNPATGNFADWKAQNRAFEEMAAVDQRTYDLTGDGEPEKIFAFGVTANFFPVLGATPELGRAFNAEEDRPGAGRVAVISHALWQSRFGGERAAVGRDLLLDGEKYTIVGVMPRDFQFEYPDVTVWVPAALTPEQLSNHSDHYLEVVGRLKPGVTAEQASEDIRAIMLRIAEIYPNEAQGIGAVAVPLREQLAGDSRRPLMLLLVAVALVLLIACANVAGVLLSRAAARRREMALRAALGASRRRIVRQLLTESLLLGGAGGLLGALLALWAFAFLGQLIPPGLREMAELKLDVPVLLFTLAVSLLAGLVFGLAPALYASGVDLNNALKQGGARAGSGAGQRRLRGAFVVAQVALALVLLVGAGLLIRTLYRLRGQYSDLRPETILTARTQLAANRYREHAQRVGFYEQVLSRVKALPGVVAAGYTTAVPLTRKGGSNGLSLEGRDNGPNSTWNANQRQVSSDYFRAMGLALREGRGVAEQDDEHSTPVVVINETMARQYWPGESAVGKRLKVGTPESPNPWMTIVGVVADVRQMSADEPVKAEMYVPYRQGAAYSFFYPRDLVVRTSVAPPSVAAAVRAAVHEVDPQQPVAAMRTMDEVLGRETAQRRVGVILLTTFAALALALSALGIYGVLSYFVVQHTPEIGVRMALGASARDVLWLVVGKGIRLALAGVFAGLLGALALTRLMRGLLFEVDAADPLTFSLIALLLVLVALAACLIPARRATKVDPLVALRYE